MQSPNQNTGEREHGGVAQAGHLVSNAKNSDIPEDLPERPLVRRFSSDYVQGEALGGAV